MKNFLFYYLPIFLTQSLFGLIIEGTVLDSKSNPIKDVEVYTFLNGVSTDKNGYFTINVDESDIIYISHIQYRKISYLANQMPSIIILHHSFINAKQIVVHSSLNKKSLNNLSKSTTTIDPKTNQSMDDFSDYANTIPNVNMIPGTSKGRYFKIRGIGEISQFAGEGPPTFSIGYYLDDMDLSGVGTIGSSFDINHIEIVRGINNLKSGYNALGGSINLYSKEPSYKREGYINLGLKNYNGYNIGLSYSLPISNNLLTKASVYKNYSNSHIENSERDIKNSNQIDEQFIRTKLLWLPLKHYHAKLNLLYYKNNNGYDIFTPDNNGYTTYTDYPGKDNLQSFALSLVNHLNINNTRYKVYLAITKNTINYNYDGDWGSDNYWLQKPYNWNVEVEGYSWSFPDFTERKRDTYSFDIQGKKTYNKIHLLFGLFNRLVNEHDIRNGYLYGGNADSINANFNILNNAAYSHIELNLNNFKINMGARYDINDLNYRSTGRQVNPETWESNSFIQNPINYSDQGISSIISVGHELSKKTTHSIEISTGYKPGGINQSIILDDKYKTYHQETNFSSEYVINYNSQALSSTINLFYIYRSNPQVRLYYQFNTDLPTSFDFYTSNANTGYTMASEMNFKILFNKYLSISQDIGLLKSILDTYFSPLDEKYYGNRAPSHSPMYNYKTEILLNHDTGLFGNITFTGLDGYYYDDQYDYKSSHYYLIHINSGFQFRKAKILFWIKNILNEKYTTRGYYFDLGIGNDGKKLYTAYGNPRTIGLALTYLF